MNQFGFLFSDSAQLAIRLSERLAADYAHANFGPEHLLSSLMKEDVGLHNMLSKIDKTAPEIQSWVDTKLDQLPKSNRYRAHLTPNDRAVAVIKETQKLCVRYGSEEITPVDLLEALCTPEVGFDADVIRRLPIALYEIIGWRNSHPNTIMGSTSQGSSIGKGSSAGQSVDFQVLDKYCDNLSISAREGKLDPLLGRDKELKNLLEILGKRLSPNVLIVGEPGVGKTAMIAGLAQKILVGNVPEKLKDATIFELDVSGRLVAGAYKGEVEERLKSVLKAIKAYEGKAILFIDEIHILLDERGGIGSGVVNLLKPELARGELTVVGVTTQSEYQKYIEKDTAFNRRFSRLVIHEPDVELATTMLEGLLPRYEEFHGLRITPPAVYQAVKLSKRYVGDKNLPVSAIELMDFTMACASQMNSTSSAILEEIEGSLSTETSTDHTGIRKIIKDKFSELLLGKLGAQLDSPVPDIPGILQTIKEWTSEPKSEILEEDIEAIIAYQSGVPIGRLQSSEQDKFKNVEEILKKRVVGQDHVVSAVARSLKTLRANVKDPKEPGAILFFTGPTGTGKTELAKAVAELLFDDEDAMIRFDMSEYQESHAVAALIGSPPGYVGYEEGGLLVNKVRKQPYSVVLFDEIEKAHPDIYGIFLQMLTDSRLMDKQGKMADFSNAIIIFTSNAGAEKIVEMFEAGQQPSPEQLKGFLRETRKFKDEFLGRVDSQILPFAPINEEVARLILGIHFKKFEKLLKSQHNVDLAISENVVNELLRIGFSPLFGARPLKNAIKSFLTPPIADKIISGDITKGDSVKLDIDEAGELLWDISSIHVQN